MENEVFLKRITYTGDAEIQEKIKNGEPYTICDLLEQTKGGMYLRDLENAIIATEDIVQIYEFLFLAVDMNIAGFNQTRFEKLIRESGNPKLMCYSMAFVPGTNIEEMLGALEQTKNAKYMELLKKDEEYVEVYEQIRQIAPDYDEKIEEARKIKIFPASLKEFEDFRDNIPELKNQIKKSKNPHLITELANYLEYLNEYHEQNYEIKDLTELQEKIGDPMQSYEYLSSVKINNKTGLIQSVINSGRIKFAYYVYTYVPDLTEEERNHLKESIQKNSTDKKYKAMLEAEEKGREREWN